MMQGSGHNGRRAAGLIVVLAALMLGGCVSNWYKTPRPFEGRHRNDPMIDSILAGASLEVRPVEGLPPAEAAALSRSISQIAHEHDIAAVTSEGAEIADRLTGRAEIVSHTSMPALPPRLSLIHDGKRTSLAAARAPGALDAVSQMEVRVSWTLTGADGEVKDTVEMSQPVTGTLPEFDRRQRTDIARRTVAWVRATLDREAASRAQAEARQSKPVVLVSPVEGATGDGRISLTTALAELLAASGRCDVLAASEQARIPRGRTAYRVTGQVEITDKGPKTQMVAIAWTLTDLAGREIGKVNQQNAIPRGSLDGAWGQTAYAAAEGAMEGLLALIQQTPALPAVE